MEFGCSAGQAGNKIRKSFLKLSTSLVHLSEEYEKGEGFLGQHSGQVSVQGRRNIRKLLYHSGFVTNQSFLVLTALRLRIFENLKMQDTGSSSHGVTVKGDMG